MTASGIFDRAITVADMTDADVLDMAHAGMTPHEIAERVAARSGHTYIRATDCTAWLLDELGPCGNCHERAGTHPMDNGGRFCAACCSAAVAYDDREEIA